MRSVKLIATDMDETLLTSDKHVPEEFYKLVSQLDHVGVVTAIASGRPLYTLKAQFPDLPLAFIADNGGVVEFHGELIHQARLKTEDYQKMISFTLQQTAGIPILCGLNSAYIPKIFEASLNHLKYFYSEGRFYNQVSHS